MGSDTICWSDDGTVRIGDTVLALFVDRDPGSGRLTLFKEREMMEAYQPIIDEFRGANVVEIGIYLGGSTAYFAAALAPRRLLGFELAAERVALLDEHLAAEGLTGSVRLHYGVDQSDGEVLVAAVGDHLDGEPIDLVIDDASHRYAPTVASFEALFPLVRPGGLYVIEDWRPFHGYLLSFLEIARDRPSPASEAMEAAIAAQLTAPDPDGREHFVRWFVTNAIDATSPFHDVVRSWYAGLLADDAPAAVELRTVLEPLVEAGVDGVSPYPTLMTLATELLVAMVNDGSGIAEVTVNPYWVAVRRSDEELDPATFGYRRATFDHFSLLERTRRTG
jgi:predicted O-methyltransferase YrrM